MSWNYTALYSRWVTTVGRLDVVYFMYVCNVFCFRMYVLCLFHACMYCVYFMHVCIVLVFILIIPLATFHRYSSKEISIGFRSNCPMAMEQSWQTTSYLFPSYGPFNESLYTINAFRPCNTKHWIIFMASRCEFRIQWESSNCIFGDDFRKIHRKIRCTSKYL